MTATPAKFTFDLDLGRNAEKGSLMTESALSKKLEAARKEGYAAGLVDGEKTAIAKANKQLLAAADQIGNQAAALVAGMDDLGRHATGEAVILAAAIARKLAAAFVEREPTGELSALIADCMSSLNGVPHLVIRCTPELADAVRDIATARMQTSGFSGRLVVLGDPDIPLGDARLEWADGGVVRSSAEINAEIDRRIADYFAAHGIVANPDEEISQ
jgi:flagellar assembly protein FliH